MPEAGGFKDHFSVAAADYGRYRPRYPPALIDFLADAAPARRLAWDCATGSGQAAVALASQFEAVLGTDASARQIEGAQAHPRVRYAVASAEDPGLADDSVDLVTVAQALHWLDLDRFYAQAVRIGRPGAVIAAWTYSLATVNEAVDACVARFYAGLDPWWPPERRHVESGYATLPFPFRIIPAPGFAMQERWTLERLLGYLGTWSAVNRCRKDTGRDPLEPLAEELSAVWRGADATRTVRWPVHLRIGFLS